MKPFKFYLIADTHYFKNSLGAFGKEYDEFMRYEQKCFAETESINKAVFNWLGEADEADTLLIAGDLTFNGEKKSHLAFIELLKDLKAKGKRIFVVTADHDCKDDPFAFGENGRYQPEATKYEELYDLYYEFGFSDAIAVDREHMSYIAQLADGVRLLALCNDGDVNHSHRFDEKHIEWIKEQTKKAREDGQMMFAMNHYPLLPGQQILSVISGTYQKDAEYVTRLLADEGVHLVFTGHMHNQSINVRTLENGNKIYDVCTGSIIADPSVIRLVEIEDESTVKIQSIPTPDFEWDTNGKTCKQYLSDLFDNMLINMFADLRDNPYNALRKLGLGDKTKIFPIVSRVFRKLNKITVGGLCRLLCIKCEDMEVRKMPVKLYAAELVRNMFEGNQSFKEGTPKGDVFIAFLKRFRPVLNKVNAKTFDGQKADLFDLLINSAGNYDIDDYNATIILK
ncbi:MAG: metallophosphoesterase [Eubacterium sp.]|nr:metallophosphoesterase [Eubacterium sp.]